MKTQDIYNAFHNEFTFLYDRGFKKNDKESLIRKTNLGFDKISILVSSYSPIYIVRFVLNTRFDELELIMNSFRDMNPKFINKTPSFMVRQELLIKKDRYEYHIETEKDIKDMGSDFEKFMNDHGWSFFEKYNDLEAIHVDVNSSPKEPCLLYNDKCSRAMYGVLVAKILNKTEFDQLVVEYRDYLKGWNEYDQGRYEKLVMYLKNEY
jgi:hypothetical protein